MAKRQLCKVFVEQVSKKLLRRICLLSIHCAQRKQIKSYFHFRIAPYTKIIDLIVCSFFLSFTAFLSCMTKSFQQQQSANSHGIFKFHTLNPSWLSLFVVVVVQLFIERILEYTTENHKRLYPYIRLTLHLNYPKFPNHTHSLTWLEQALTDLPGKHSNISWIINTIRRY